MNADYSSNLAQCISAFIAMKRSGGLKYETAEYYLHDFDNYCSRHAYGSSLSRELVLDWAKIRNQESPAVHALRLSPLRELGKYMQSVGISEAFVLPTGLSGKTERYVPHFFTNEELTAFFAACDNLKPHQSKRARHLVLPALFRLLYCCGLRICEARTLRVENVDLNDGRIDIISSKGCRSRRILVSDDLLELFKRYDERVSKIYPRRVYFFPTTRSQCYKSLSEIFRKIWRAAGLGPGCGNRPRAYDLRHHFALSNLNRWIASGVDVNSRLPYLSRYMGHSCIESTDYYLHLVPAFFQTFCEKVRATEALLPEVDYENE
ncbi:MAG: tyrosine-type recombinase/integrase [Spirochaetia bacterium]